MRRPHAVFRAKCGCYSHERGITFRQLVPSDPDIVFETSTDCIALAT
jgi:hypothetical protein